MQPDNRSERSRQDGADELHHRSFPPHQRRDSLRRARHGQDEAEAVEDAFRYGKLILATTTYNADIFPFMREFIDHLTEREYQNRKIAFVENGTWAPQAAKIMKSKFEKSKNITFANTTVSIRSAMSEQNKIEILSLTKEMK